MPGPGVYAEQGGQCAWSRRNKGENGEKANKKPEFIRLHSPL